MKLITRKHVAIEIETYHNEEGLKSRIIKVAGIIIMLSKRTVTTKREVILMA